MLSTATKRKSNAAVLNVLKHQKAVLESEVKFLLFVAGFGSGKTHTMNLVATTNAVAFPGLKIGVFAPTYDLLRLNNVPSLLEMLESLSVGYTFNKSDFIATLDNGAQIIFRSLDNPARIVGFELGMALLDEFDIMSQVKAQEAWNKVLARVRQVVYSPLTGKMFEHRVWVFTTPEGFRFCYHRWVKEGGEEYGIIRARTMDNPFLPSGYIDSLRSTYPSNLIEAYLEGQFVNLNAGAVYYAFDRNIQNSDAVVRAGEPLYVGMDFNVGHMAAIVYVQRINEHGVTWHAVNEFIDFYDTPELCQAIKETYIDGQKSPHSITAYPDASGARKDTRGGNKSSSESDHAIIRKHGFKIKARETNPRIKDRVAAMNAGFENKKLWVNIAQCPNYTEALEQQIYGPAGLPDKTAGVDHANDAGGYPVAYEMPLVERKAYLSMVSM